MTFHIPTTKRVRHIAHHLSEDYESIRTEMDKKRTLSSIRSATNNPNRKSDIQFLQNLAMHIYSSRNGYKNMDPQFKHAGESMVTDFLKNACAGGLLLILIDIAESYNSKVLSYLFNSAVKKSSALGQCILDLFQIETLAEAPVQKIHDCLMALKQYLSVMNNTSSPIQWHNNLKNDQLNEKIERQLKTVAEQLKLESAEQLDKPESAKPCEEVSPNAMKCA